MGYVDCNTIPFLWNYAARFTLFDNIFQTTVGPSTPNAIAMISGQSGETQYVKHHAATGTNIPVTADPIPFWGSVLGQHAGEQPAAPAGQHHGREPGRVQRLAEPDLRQPAADPGRRQA